LIGAGLQLVGWQIAVMAEFEGNEAVTPPVELTAMLPGLVDIYVSASPLITLLFVSVTVAVSARGVLSVTLALVAPVEATLSASLAGGQVKKYPALLLVWAMVPVINVEPGACAVATPF
jgi:hypothetical protein